MGLWPGQPGTQEIFEALSAVRPLLAALHESQAPHYAEDSPWATLVAIAAAGPDPVSAEHLVELTGMLPLRAMWRRLRVLAEWGLLEVIRGPRGVRLYRIPDPVRQLLVDLANPDGIADPTYQSAVRTLAPLLAQNANLLPESPKTAPLSQAVAVLFELNASPLAHLPPRVAPDSLWGTLLGLADANRPVTVKWLAERQQLSPTGVTNRLSALHRLGLVVREVRWQTGEVVFSLAEPTPELLAQLADPAAIEPDGYRAAVERLTEALGRSTNMAGTAAREEILAAVDAVLDLPGGPLAALVLRVHPGSPHVTLLAIGAAGDAGTTIGELGGESIRRQVRALYRLGLLDRHANTDSDSTERWRYTLTDPGLLDELAQLADPSRIDPGRLPALWTLARLINQPVRLAADASARRQVAEALAELAPDARLIGSAPRSTVTARVELPRHNTVSTPMNIVSKPAIAEPR